MLRSYEVCDSYTPEIRRVHDPYMCSFGSHIPCARAIRTRKDGEKKVVPVVAGEGKILLLKWLVVAFTHIALVGFLFD